MGIESRVLGTYAGDGTGTFSVPLDSAPVAGEYVLVSCEVNYDATTGDVVSGYDSLGNAEAVRNAFAPRLALFGHRAVAGEPASISVAGPAATSSHAIIVTAHTNVHTTDPLAGGPVFALDGRDAGAAVGLTPDDSPSRVLWTLAAQNYRAEADTQIVWADAAELAQATSTFCVSSLAYLDRTDTSATGTRAWSVTSPYSGNTDGTVSVVALREAPAGPTTPQPVAQYPVDATAVTMTSPAFTPAEFEVLVVKGITGDESRTLTAIGNTGTALAWSGNRGPGAANTNYAANYLWTAVVPAGGVGEITVQVTANAYTAGVPVSMVVERWTLAKLAASPAINTPQAGPTTNAAPSSVVTTVAAGSVVTWTVAGWNGTAGTATYRGTPTQVYARRTTNAINSWFAYQAAPSAGAQTFGLTAPVDKWTAAGIELQYRAPDVTPPAGPEPGRMLLAA